MADREAALAELLGEINGEEEGTGAEAGSPTLHLDQLDVTTDGLDGEDDALGLMADLDLEQINVVRNIMRSEGSDLKERAMSVEAKLQTVELESISDYVAESDNLLALHTQIEGTDGILETMESLLSGFKNDLGKISSEIKSLQEQSLGMSIKLRNRKAAERRLGSFVEEITVPPDLITAVLDDEVTEAYLERLVDLNRRLGLIDRGNLAKTSAAADDVRPELERLRSRACLKARDFLMQKLYSLRKPKTNIQILQQNVLLRFKYLITFLRQHAPEVLTEVRACYVETMSRVLKQALQGYVSSLAYLQQDIAGRGDLLGAEQGLGGGGGGTFFGQFGGGRSVAGTTAAAAAMKNRSSVFSLGARAQVLSALETTPPIIIHQVESSGAKFPHERLFRSSQKLLMDTATFEYLFCQEFWSGDAAVFQEIFAGPLAVMEEQLQLGVGAGGGNLFGGNFDAIGLLLMIRINREHQVIMSRRRVPCLDHYLDGVNLTLWPRFKTVFDAHLKSVVDATSSPAVLNTLWSEDMPVHAHYVTRRYAEFAASMTALGDGLSVGTGDGQLESNLERLRAAAADLLLKLAERFPSRKRRVVFLVNNYDCICSVLREAKPVVVDCRTGKGVAVAGGRGEGRVGDGGTADDSQAGGLSLDNSATYRFFDEQLTAMSHVFVEEELADHFGPLIDFVRKAEAAQKSAGEEGTGAGSLAAEKGLGGGSGDDEGTGGGLYNPKAASVLMRDFAERWKGAIEQMHHDVITHFSNLQRGMDILQRTLSQLLIYYTRFTGPEGVLMRMGPEGAALCKEAVTNPAFIYEIKRHSQSRVV